MLGQDTTITVSSKKEIADAHEKRLDVLEFRERIVIIIFTLMFGYGAVGTASDMWGKISGSSVGDDLFRLTEGLAAQVDSENPESLIARYYEQLSAVSEIEPDAEQFKEYYLQTALKFLQILNTPELDTYPVIVGMRQKLQEFIDRLNEAEDDQIMAIVLELENFLRVIKEESKDELSIDKFRTITYFSAHVLLLVFGIIGAAFSKWVKNEAVSMEEEKQRMRYKVRPYTIIASNIDYVAVHGGFENSFEGVKMHIIHLITEYAKLTVGATDNDLPNSLELVEKVYDATPAELNIYIAQFKSAISRWKYARTSHWDNYYPMIALGENLDKLVAEMSGTPVEETKLLDTGDIKDVENDSEPNSQLLDVRKLLGQIEEKTNNYVRLIKVNFRAHGGPGLMEWFIESTETNCANLLKAVRAKEGKKIFKAIGNIQTALSKAQEHYPKLFEKIVDSEVLKTFLEIRACINEYSAVMEI